MTPREFARTMETNLHKLAKCERVKGSERYHYKSWSMDFACPTCGRRVHQSLQYLGSRKMFCDGRRSYRVGDAVGDVRKAGLDLREWCDAHV
jgi:hypothetical protein